MAKTRKVVTEETVDENQQTGQIETDAPSSAEEADVLAALTELEGADEVKWRVSRVAPKEKAGFLDDYTSAELSLVAIREKWGGGKLRIVGFKRGKYFASTTIDVQEVPASKTGVIVAPDPLVAQAANDERMIRWITVLSPLITAIVGNKPQPVAAPSITEMVAALAGLKQLQGADRQGSELDSVLKGMELAHKLQSKDGETNYLDLVRDFLPMAKPVIERLGQAIPVRTPPQQPPTDQVTRDLLSLPGAMPNAGDSGATPPAEARSTAGGSPAPDSQPVGQGDDAVMLTLIPWLRQQLEMLIYQARRAKDPELYAELLIDNIPENVPVEKLREWLARDDWWQILQQFHAGVQPYEGWFKDLRDLAIATIDDMIADAAHVDINSDAQHTEIELPSVEIAVPAPETT